MADKTSKELKQPDAFQQVGAEAQAWFQERQNMIAVVAGLILLGGFIAALVHYLGERKETQAAQQLGLALEPVSRPVSETGAPTDLPPGEPPPFKTQQEKDEAIVKQMREYLDAHAGAETAYAAAIPLGQASYRLGRYDDALKAYDQVLEKAPKDEPLRIAALEGRGYAHEAKGELDKAYAAFQEMAKENASEFLKGMGRYHQGRILTAQGKKDEAAKTFVEVSSQAPGTAAARLASERVASLAAQGVTIPQAPPPAAGGADAGVTATQGVATP